MRHEGSGVVSLGSPGGMLLSGIETVPTSASAALIAVCHRASRVAAGPPGCAGHALLARPTTPNSLVTSQKPTSPVVGLISRLADVLGKLDNSTGVEHDREGASGADNVRTEVQQGDEWVIGRRGEVGTHTLEDNHPTSRDGAAGPCRVRSVKDVVIPTLCKRGAGELDAACGVACAAHFTSEAAAELVPLERSQSRAHVCVGD